MSMMIYVTSMMLMYASEVGLRERERERESQLERARLSIDCSRFYYNIYMIYIV